MSPRIVLSIAALLCLSACASPTELRGRKADIDAMTDKTAELVAGCIGDEFEKFNVGFIAMQGIKISSRPTANGYSISGTQSGLAGSDTVFLVDVTKADGKTHVMMFDNFIVSGGGKWATLARGCL